MNEELKPCPFCGSKDSPELISPRDISIDKTEQSFKAICCNILNGCGASGGFYEDAIKATEAWNKRN